MKFIKMIIYFLIQLIEKIEYINIDLDEDDITKKILFSAEIEDLQVTSDSGLVDISHIHTTQPYTHWELILENGYKLTCADNHIVFSNKLTEIFVKDLKVGDILNTDVGDVPVISVRKLRYKTSMGDLTIDTPEHRYYTGGILSHNTISSSIFLLHYLLFNNDKNVLIAANKGDTSAEIIEKVKHIYEGLPFFLQQGIVTWNEKTVRFENNCKMKGFTMTATSSIGQTADFVYVDEFAYIPDTIARKFYKSIKPTMDSIKNSKMIITSTPNGLNLFHDLLVSAERPKGDPLKNRFNSMRTYWYQVPGRNVSYIRPDQFKMANHNIDYNDILKYCMDTYNPSGDGVTKSGLPLVAESLNEETNQMEIHIQNTEWVDTDDLRAICIKNRLGEDVSVNVFSEISSWKLDAILDIGGITEFNQEYDLRFVNASKSLFSETIVEKLQDNVTEFAHLPHDIFKKLTWDCSALTFTTDESLFNVANRRKTMGIITVDVSEGLGQDYSVINIFKICRKSDEEIALHKDKFKDFSDFFCLKQIGIFRSNLVSIEQLSELLYLIAFEYFDEDKFKIVLEINNHGHSVLASMKSVFNGDNEYGSHIFLKFKHRQDSPKLSYGIKVSKNKNIMVRKYQDCINAAMINVYEHNTVKEITTFVKHENAHGNVSYKADGSCKDDCVMTLVNLSSVFDHNIYKDMVDEFMQEHPDKKFIASIDIILGKSETSSGTDYGSFLGNVKRAKQVKSAQHTNKVGWARNIK